MNNHTIGFIGYGNMAQAIAQGMVDAGVLDGEHIVALSLIHISYCVRIGSCAIVVFGIY